MPLIIMRGAIFEIPFENPSALFRPTAAETMPSSDVAAPIVIILSVWYRLETFLKAMKIETARPTSMGNIKGPPDIKY